MDPMGMDNYEASIMCIIDGASLCHFGLSQPVETCANQIESIPNNYNHNGTY